MATKIEDSNIALLSSDLALKVRKESALCEAAFDGIGEDVGLHIWRIEKMQVVKWPNDLYGKFFSGDSYIILNSYRTDANDKLLHNVHFWLGQNTSQDEAGVAAYKTVELDDRLGQTPVQFREVQSYETDDFLSLFKPAVLTMDGGMDSGFNSVTPTEYEPRLMHVKGQRKFVRVKQVPLALDSLNDGDVFLLDNGLQIFQWNGTESGVFEKRKANEVAAALREDRQGKPEFRVLDGEEECEEFWSLLGGIGSIASAEAGGKDSGVTVAPKKIVRLSDASGALELTEVASGELSKSTLETEDVFLVDNGGIGLFVWVGAGASQDERGKAFQYANEYIKSNQLPLTIPVSRVVEGAFSLAFDKVFE